MQTHLQVFTVKPLLCGQLESGLPCFIEAIILALISSCLFLPYCTLCMLDATVVHARKQNYNYNDMMAKKKV